MNHLLAGLVLFVFPQEAKDAEAFLKSVEEKAANARTLKFSSTASATLVRETFTFTSAGSFKSGGKARAGFDGEILRRKVKVTLVSDGVKTDLQSDKTSTFDTPKDFDSSLRILMLRLGTTAALTAADGRTDLKNLVRVSDVAFAADEKVGEVAAKVVTFTLTVVSNGERRACRLWIDPKTLAPLKHYLKVDEIQDSTETFSEWKVDEEIKDEVFKRK